MDRAALYIRVSTEEQTEFSPDAQKKALMDYAAKNNILVSEDHIFLDEGYSGKTASKRPAFMRMIGMAKLKDKPFDVILVHKFDRFARNREVSVTYKTKLMKDNGIKVISITESVEDDKMGIIVEAILEAMAEYYSINLAEEVKKGMTEKARRGEFQSTPPLGYRMGDESHLMIVPSEAEHIKYIFNQYVYENKGCFTIARDLNQMGIRSKRGSKMDNRGIQYILCNPTYVGKVRWTPTMKAKRNFKHPDSIIAESTHEPIISNELFERAQMKIRSAKNKKKPKARPSSECKHWLSGLMKCSDCSSTLVLAATLKYPSFQCHGYSKGKCSVSHSITLKKLEAAILDELKNILSHVSDNEFEINISKVSNKQQEMDILKKSAKNIENQCKRANEAYLGNVYSLQEFSEIKSKLNQEKEEMIAEISRLKSEEASKVRLAFQRTFKDIVDLLNSDIAMEYKKEAARSIIDKIVYDKANECLEIYFHDV